MPRDDGGAEEDEIGARRIAVWRRPHPDVVRGRLLLDGGKRLAGERGLLHVEIAGLDEPRVGGHEIAGGEADDVARHELGARQLPPAPSRSTVAVGTIVCRSRSAADVERAVCTASSSTLSATVPTMMSASTVWPVHAATPLAASRMSMSGLASCDATDARGRRASSARARSRRRPRAGAEPRRR